MNDNTKIFVCKGKQFADYLLKRGAKLIEIRSENGTASYIFKHDDTIDEYYKQWESMLKKCLF